MTLSKAMPSKTESRSWSRADRETTKPESGDASACLK
jgi:hypothetical protein